MLKLPCLLLATVASFATGSALAADPPDASSGYSVQISVNNLTAPNIIEGFAAVNPIVGGMYDTSLYANPAPSIDLGDVELGTKLTRILAVQNVSGKPMSGAKSIFQLSSSSDRPISSLTCTPPFTLTSAAPDEVCDLIINFTPTQAGLVSFSIKASGATDSNELGESTFNFVANVIDPNNSDGPGIVMNPPMVEFPVTAPFDVSYQEISVYNRSADSSLLDLRAVINGSYFNIASSDCGVGFDFEFVDLPGGSSCNITVSFTPEEEGDFIGSLTMDASNSNNGTQSALLSGSTGTPPPTGLAIKWGSQYYSDEGVSSHGEAWRSLGDLLPAGIFEINIAESNLVSATSFSIVPIVGNASIDTRWSQSEDCITQVPHTLDNGTCLIYVMFQPEFKQNIYTFRLDIEGLDASGNPASLSRTITGVVPYNPQNLYANSYNLDLSNLYQAGIEIPEWQDYLADCGAFNYCGVSRVRIANDAGTPIVIESVQYALHPRHSDFKIDSGSLNLSCSGSIINQSWVPIDTSIDPDYFPANVFTGFFYQDPDSYLSGPPGCADKLMVELAGQWVPEQSTSAIEGRFVEYTATVNYINKTTGEPGVFTFTSSFEVMFRLAIN